jgi:hypothetical protein
MIAPESLGIPRNAEADIVARAFAEVARGEPQIRDA